VVHPNYFDKMTEYPWFGPNKSSHTKRLFFFQMSIATGERTGWAMCLDDKYISLIQQSNWKGVGLARYVSSDCVEDRVVEARG
jgi:hypothetical protein